MIHDKGWERARVRATLRSVVVAGAIMCAASCGGLDGGQPPSGAEPETAIAPVIAANGDLSVAAALDQAVAVNVRSRKFADKAALFRFAIDEMGGEPIYDAAGEIVGARGVSLASGEIDYRDESTGTSFKTPDLAQAFLGGGAGTIEVGGEVVKIRATVPASEGELTTITSALTGDSQACVGGDCITGHSWKTDAILYHSVGSESKQSSGGFGTTTYPCCSSGTLVSSKGGLLCRIVTEWEPADPEHGVYKPIPLAYSFGPTQTCAQQGTVNTLTIGVTAILPSGFVGNSSVRSVVNSREVSLSNWAVGVGVSFLGIDDVAGVCGFHSGSRGGSSRTRAGNATDARCNAITAPQALTGSSAASTAVSTGTATAIQ